MVAILIRFSTAAILRFADNGNLDGNASRFEQWHPLFVLPSHTDLNLEQLQNSRWTALGSSSPSDFGEFDDLAKAVLATTSVPASECVVTFKQEQGNYFCKLARPQFDKLSENIAGPILLVTHLSQASKTPAEMISDDEMQAALDHVNQKYANALQRLAE